jgi:leader peptidase (prepilin peptidase) / N-methyltransferase
MMHTYAVGFLAFVLGTLIGSFLNVVILRTHTKRTLGGRSRCMSCGTALTLVDLVPIISYLALVGRCRHCGARISPRYLVIELLSGVLYMGAVLSGVGFPLLLIELLFLSILLIIFVYDLEHLIIPNEYVIALTPLAFGLLMFRGWGSNATIILDVLAPMLTFAFFGGLWAVSKGRWIGLGDAKLSIPLALAVGFSQVFSLVVFSFWLGAVISVSLLVMSRALKRGKQPLRFFGIPLTMKAEVPFAPFLIGSFLLVYYAHADVFTLTNSLFAPLLPY